jgi:hypothetical protein
LAWAGDIVSDEVTEGHCGIGGIDGKLLVFSGEDGIQFASGHRGAHGDGHIPGGVINDTGWHRDIGTE